LDFRKRAHLIVNAWMLEVGSSALPSSLDLSTARFPAMRMNCEIRCRPQWGGWLEENYNRPLTRYDAELLTPHVVDSPA